MWDKLVGNVFDEVTRCVDDIRTQSTDSSRAEPLHAKVIQSLEKHISSTKTNSIGLSLRPDGISLLINPHYFLNTLSTREERIAILRHVENHFFLSHPFRAYQYREMLLEQKDKKWDASLFYLLAEIECQHFISGYKNLMPDLDQETTSELPLNKGSSVEYMYSEIYPLWQELLEKEEQAPLFSTTSNPRALAQLYALKKRDRICDHQHWLGERSDITKKVVEINDVDMELLEKEAQRILIVAREALDINDIKELPPELNGKLDGFLAEYDLKRTDPETAKKVEKLVSKLILRFVLKDPFFGHFLSGCIRQITDTLPTAGVALLKKFILLLVNPSFFMNSLQDDAERAGVLKHEALHIMLKHVIQMHNPKFSHKRLYNIAADLEVNQYIGPPWKLPEEALFFDKPPFDVLNLPPNDVAENYYVILKKAIDSDDPKYQLLRDLCEQEGSLGGHSYHGGWKEGGINRASTPERDVLDQDIERMVREAKDILGKKGLKEVPKKFIDLLKEWEEARRPKIDWKKKLRLFVSSNPKTTIKKSSRKKSKRYAEFKRQSIRQETLTLDVFLALYRKSPELFPSLQWDDINEDLRQTLSNNDPHIKQEGMLSYTELSFYSLYQVIESFPKDTWPSWEQVPDDILKSLSCIRIPLDPKVLPTDLYIQISRTHSQLLPKLTWDMFSPIERRRLKKQYPFLIQPIWGLFPAEEILNLRKEQPELFTLTWSDVPQVLIAKMPFFALTSKQPFRIDRILRNPVSGLKKIRLWPRILVIIDTSGSVSDIDIECLFAEIDGMYRVGSEIHVLQVDTQPQLYHIYTGEKPLAGRGGTDFDAAFQWLNDARFGIKTMVKHPNEEGGFEEEVRVKFDGAIYLTDGAANTPRIKPYCKLLWVLTPNGTKQYIQGQIIQLPPYENR